MANKTKLPQTNTNQNVFTLDDGTKEITLVNPYGKSFASCTSVPVTCPSMTAIRH